MRLSHLEERHRSGYGPVQALPVYQRVYLPLGAERAKRWAFWRMRLAFLFAFLHKCHAGISKR